jgi:hypothetical protein
MTLPTRTSSFLPRGLVGLAVAAALAGCAGGAGPRPSAASAELPPALRGNLLKNPGFEESAERILPWHIIVHADPESYGYTLVPEAAYAGARGIRLERKANEPWGGLFQQLAYNNPQPARLRFTAWVRGEGIEEPAVMQVRYGLDFADDRASTVFIPVDQLDSGWSQVKVELAMPAGPTGVEVTLLQYGPGHLHADELSLEVVRD